MKSFDECLSTINVTSDLVVQREGYQVATAKGGCNFVVDPAKPHLGGNLDGGDMGTKYPDTVWPWIMTKFAPKTMLDVGCAEGCTLEWFVKHGVIGMGIEGLKRNVDVCLTKKLNVVEHDLTVAPYVWTTDMVWCSDVVEHIEERFLDNVMNTFRSGQTLFVSHGLEDSSGWHHVTNKGHDWWIERIESAGFQYQKELSEESRALCSTGWWRLSGKIFRRL